MNVIVDGALILNREMLHDTLSTALRLPAWYGRNLDALYDCLTDVQEETVVILRDRAALEEHLGGYGRRFLKLLEEVSWENPHIRLGAFRETPEE